MNIFQEILHFWEKNSEINFRVFWQDFTPLFPYTLQQIYYICCVKIKASSFSFCCYSYIFRINICIFRLQCFHHRPVGRVRPQRRLPEEESGPVQLQGQHGEPGPGPVLPSPPSDAAAAPTGPRRPDWAQPGLLVLPAAFLCQVQKHNKILRNSRYKDLNVSRVTGEKPVTFTQIQH